MGTGCKSRTLPDAVSFYKTCAFSYATAILREGHTGETSQKTCLYRIA